jgi:hypothetical protein
MSTPYRAYLSHESLASRIAPWLCLVAVIAALAWAFIVGRNAQAAGELWERNEVARETKEFCTGLRFQEHDSDYARCVSGLDELRRKQKERDAWM